jgi:hypothetical protein
MKKFIPVMLVALTVVGSFGRPVMANQRRAGSRASDVKELRGGSRSPQELVDKFLRALKEKDQNALRNLRVTQDEYRRIIVPGSVKPNEPPRKLVPDWIEFAWGSLDERSRHNERALVDTLGGMQLTVRDFVFDGGERQYAGYTAHRRLRVDLADNGGKDLSIETGSIAEVQGRYKFIAFMRD